MIDINQPIGASIYGLVQRLWPICRSITGPGVRETLKILKENIPELKIHEVASGTQCFDWIVPKEWTIRDAYVLDPDGKKIIDFKKNNLHVLGYSTPIERDIELDELQQHLYSLPDQPTAIPYVTSYYKERWGFCLSHDKRNQLKAGTYRVKIDAELKDGHLTYGEIIMPGRSDKEIFLSTYICHPSMANNELSGPCVTTFLTKWLNTLGDRKYTYRIVFIPETIGSICYLSKNLQHLKEKVHAGFVITCIGDERTYSFLPSRQGDTVSDGIAQHVLHHIAPNYKKYTFLDRGSDERQYCSPGVDLPMATIMRSKYGCYPEYHTSLDDLKLVTPKGLEGGYMALRRSIEILEANRIPKVAVFCEPQLGPRGLYPTISTKESAKQVRTMMNLIAYADGSRSLFDIAYIIKAPFWEIESLCTKLEEHGLIESSEL